MKNIWFLTLLFAGQAFAVELPTCSNARLYILRTKKQFLGQSGKDAALKEAVCRRDYCATKFWLEQGADFEKACGTYPMRSQYTPSVLYLPVILYLVYPAVAAASNEQMLDLLKDYGVKEIRWQLKSGFNMIRVC